MSELEESELVAREEEPLFARDFDGQLVRLDKVTAEDFEKRFTIKIDGHDVPVQKAVPATDAQGNIRRDAAGKPIPRATTIYDAAQQLYRERGEPNPIPILCHQDHLDPVAVCRLCSVEIWKMKRGQVQRERKLLPACQHRVEETMEVHTLNSPDDGAKKRIHSAVGVLTELLVTDHLPTPAKGASQHSPGNELANLAARMNIEATRFPQRTNVRGRDDSSHAIAVDHEACILCDRCVRGCDDVKKNYIIGRAGKGFTTHIAFDLDSPMGESNCVSCGECMISCPTDALTFKPRDNIGVDAMPDPRKSGTQVLSADAVKRYPLFAGLPYKFLQWNTGSVRRHQVLPGDVLCKQGDPGTTAFVIISGEYEILVKPPTSIGKEKGNPFNQLLGKLTTRVWHVETEERVVATVTSDDVIVGEMTCMSHYPRSATVRAKTAGEILEINRNVLFYLQRDRAARARLDRAYRKNALANHLRSVPFITQLEDRQRRECTEFLRERAELIHVDPGQPIFTQGEPADHYYLVRLGFVKVSQTQGDQERVVDYLGPGKGFGEIGLLSGVQAIAAEHFPAGMSKSVRTATCTALDDVELVRIRGEHFRELVERYEDVREPLVRYAQELLRRDQSTRPTTEIPLDDFLSQGLFNAQRLLVLDLESCTRCDECTRACSDTHEGITRLIREGMRFDKFLVASSCRSCLDPYCLVGCPVDAIHRRPRQDNERALEIVIEDKCIGCGLCSRNCPYGNITMHPVEGGVVNREFRATTCDLCRDVVPANQQTSCVYACPHNAAFRMSGAELLNIVNQPR
jgi:CRP-like cAMP-binding protein/Fe-S-cluster-containing dehydrogenase component